LIPAGLSQSAQPFRASETPHIYNLSLSKRVTPGLLLYANTGTSYRPPVASIGIQGDLAASADPQLRTLTFHPSEHTRAYEVGFKATFLAGRGRLNAALFRQHFENLTVFVPGVTYANTIPTPPQNTNFDFTASVDAQVQGFDIDSALQITPRWNVAFQMSYADGKIQNSNVPCNLTNAAGEAVFNTDGLISLCPGGSSSRLPLWNASLQTEYVRPVSDKVDGFVRGLVTYYPQNRNRAEPDFTVDQYSLANVYAGLRSHDGAWELSLFARNAFDTNRTLDVQSVQLNNNTQLGTTFPELVRPTGYYLTQSTPRREVGINVHYAWGSR
jgi:iron complex outermembrane receptor protein